MDLNFNKTEEKTLSIYIYIKKKSIKDFTKLSDTVLITLDNLEAKKFFHIMPLKDLKKSRKPQITLRTESL